jgi:hypothetical protein
MSRTKGDENQGLEALLSHLEAKVRARGEAAKKEAALTTEIAQLAAEARNKGATMPQLTQIVRRWDKRSGDMLTVTRQALDTMIKVETGRREPRVSAAQQKQRLQRRRQVHRLRDEEGLSFPAIGRALEISAQRAAAIYKQKLEEEPTGGVNVEAFS